MRPRLPPIALFLLTATPALAANPIPFPHPQITEVLFNVPVGDDFDANRDGRRDATGDEFIEIANPFSRPIQLEGYTLSSRLSAPDRDTGKGVRFVFPACELPPNGIVVVFNGFDSSIEGPVGSPETAPEAPNKRFSGALVFTTGNTARQRALSNSGDFILLSAPDGSPIDCITWGAPRPPPPTDALRIEEVHHNPKGSVQRLTPGAEIEPHPEIDGAPFSPGRIPLRTVPAPGRR